MRWGEDDVEQRVSTGRLPAWDEVDSLTREAHARHRALLEGEVADYIPALAAADPSLFGLSVAEVDGHVHDVGDTDHPFTIQSVSKAFVHALVCQRLGHATVRERVGVDNTGLPFDSVVAIELGGDAGRRGRQSGHRSTGGGRRGVRGHPVGPGGERHVRAFR